VNYIQSKNKMCQWNITVHFRFDISRRWMLEMRVQFKQILISRMNYKRENQRKQF